MEQRLIDANALNNKLLHRIERTWGKEGAKVFAMIVSEIDSAPTVETTDDVLARLPNTKGNLKMGLELHYDPEIQKWACGYPYTQRWGYGLTRIEAVTRLEASINRK